MEFVGEEIPVGLRAVFVLIATVEIAVGVTGNSLLLTVLFRSGLMGTRVHHNLFIANLAIADMLGLIYWLPFFVLDMILEYHPVANQAHCQANGFIFCFCFIVSLLSLVSIAFNRYLNVCHSRLYRRVFTKTTVIVWCLLLWLTGAVLSVPPLFGVGSYGYNEHNHVCTYSCTGNAYPKAVAVTAIIGSTLAVSSFNLAIFSLWKRTVHNLGRRLWVSVSSLSNSRRDCLSLCPCTRRRKADTQGKWPEKREETGDCVKSEIDTDGQVCCSRVRVLADETSLERVDRKEPGRANVRPASSISVLSEYKQVAPQALDLSAISEETQESSNIAHICESPELAETHNMQPVPLEDTDWETDEDSEEYIGLGLEETSTCHENTWDEARDTATEATLYGIATSGALHGVAPEDKSSDIALNCTLSRQPKRRSGRQRNTHSGNWQDNARRRRKQQRKKRALVRSLIVVSLLIVLCFLPYGTFTMLVEFFPESEKGVPHIFVLLLLFVNWSFNWLVYGLMNRSIKPEYAKLMEHMSSLCNPCGKSG